MTHANLLENPSAVYLFKERDSYKGRRLSLTKIREEKDSPLIDEISRRHRVKDALWHKSEPRFLGYFTIDKVRPLIGDGETNAA